MMNEFWNARYQEEGYAYGTEPNVFFKEALEKYPTKGRILLPAEGEGRNAVYAAQKGLKVDAFDTSEAGKEKAEALAKNNNVQIRYFIGDLFSLSLQDENFDVIALIYAHFPPENRRRYHKKLQDMLKPGGLLIIEAFSKNHLEMQKQYPNVGGPKDENLLFSANEIKTDFDKLMILQLEDKETFLNEGKYHVGVGSVIRFVGRKNKAALFEQLY